MIKYFDEENIIFHKLLFPFKRKKKLGIAFEKQSVIVGLGGNVGDTYWTFKKVFNRFKSNQNIKILSSSPILQNPAFGFLKQKNFLNVVIVLNTSMQVNEFLKYILQVEKSFGRVRLFQNAPRTIDIDIIFFKNKRIRKNNLIIPHDKWRDRLSVILPLSFS